ncbi:unnamed protein product [Pedinophyceae sp. YPF-701]|nr:unnamed protein product [Pedinophyceae sp. YPF-701]
MPSITNVGGSITSLVALTSIAWGIRFFRKHALRRSSLESGQLGGRGNLPALPALTPAAVRKLVHQDPIPHRLIDIRQPNEVAAKPLPSDLGPVACIPANELGTALSARGEWPVSCGGRRPSTEALLVLIGPKPEHCLQAVRAARSSGYRRLAAVRGGAQSFLHHDHHNNNSGSGRSRQENGRGSFDKPDSGPRYLGRDALAVLLSRAGAPGSGCVILDVRRSDERSMYGGIRGTHHLPAADLPQALDLPPEQFEATWRFPKPAKNTVLALLSRGERRAVWAARVAEDAGWTRPLCCKGGTAGWQMAGSNVLSYPHYERGEEPPEPHVLPPRPVGETEGFRELRMKGLIA